MDFLTLKEASTKNCESVEKGKFMMKIFFQTPLNKVLKKFSKMISVDLKANVKQGVK